MKQGSKEKHKNSEPMDVALSEKGKKTDILRRNTSSRRKESPPGEAGATELKVTNIYHPLFL